MEPSHALHFVKSLAAGLDPETGSRLSAESIFERPDTIRALFVAALAIEEKIARDRRKYSLPANTGKAWSTDDDEKLIQEFDRGRSSRELAADFGRTPTSISLRLQKLGKIDLPSM